MRRLTRVAKDWGDPLYIVKLDVAKAFDSVSQLHMGELITREVGLRGGQHLGSAALAQFNSCPLLHCGVRGRGRWSRLTKPTAKPNSLAPAQILLLVATAVRRCLPLHRSEPKPGNARHQGTFQRS